MYLGTVVMVLAMAFARSKAMVSVNSFYPFGVANGDVYLNPGDDTSSAAQGISVPFNFFNYSHSSLWVNVNGAISFVAPISSYTPSCAPVSRDFRMISPFWADVDTQKETPTPYSGISYRESTSPAILQQAQTDVIYAFPDLAGIQLTWAYIVTWNNVTFYYDNPSSTIRNTFQAVITTNGVYSFAIFYYNKIQWTTGRASNGTVDGLGGIPAQVGFDAGDGVNRLMLDVSCTSDVINVNSKSNVDNSRPGVYVFQVNAAEIETPPPVTRPTFQPVPTYAEPTTVATTDPRSNALGSECSTNSKEAWVDVIFVVDTSKAMTQRSLQILSGQLATTMSQFNVAQTGDHTSRGALITYNSNAITRYSLVNASSNSELQTALLKLKNYANTDDDGVNLQQGLKLAQQELEKYSSNRVPVVVIAAATYSEEGFNGASTTATSMKEDDVKIVVINFAASETVLTNNLKNLSSPGYYYVSTIVGLDKSLEVAFTQVNCYCPPGTLQFRIFDDANQNYTSYGDCLYGSNGDTNPSIAQLLCDPGVLAPITSQAKLDFIHDNILPHDLSGRKNYTIGLHKVGKQWFWWDFDSTEYPLGDFPSFYQSPTLDASYGYMSNYFGYNWGLMGSGDVPMPYLCELKACDAHNHCLRS